MTLEALKAEVRSASPEVQAELLTLLSALRRSLDPTRQSELASKLDEPGRWISEDEAARRLGMVDGDAR